MSNTVISEILNHDTYIGSVLDCAEDIKAMKDSTISNTQNRVLGGIESKQDRRMMYSAKSKEDDWNYFAQRYGLKLMPVVQKPDNFISEESDKPKAKVKKLPKTSSYVSATKVNDKLVKEFIYRMKLEDVLDIKPSNNPFSGKDTEQLYKVVRFEVKHPYFILTVVSAEDEHDRLTDTRTLDETSEMYFTFDYRQVWDSEIKKMVENPQVTKLRNWAKAKLTGNYVTFDEALNALVDRVYLISSKETIIKNGAVVPNPDFIGYPTYTIDHLDTEFNKDNRDYVGYKTNIHISNRKIAEEKGDIRYVRTSNSIDIYSGDNFLRSYHIFGTDDK